MFCLLWPLVRKKGRRMVIVGTLYILLDDSNNCQPLYWSSFNSKRVTCSGWGNEWKVFANAFDMAHTSKDDLRHTLERASELIKLPYSLFLFEFPAGN